MSRNRGLASSTSKMKVVLNLREDVARDVQNDGLDKIKYR
jgi:hypothetical protein